MKPTLTALVLATVMGAAPALAFNIDTSTVTPTITFPEPAPQPVSQGTIKPLK